MAKFLRKEGKTDQPQEDVSKCWQQGSANAPRNVGGRDLSALHRTNQSRVERNRDRPGTQVTTRAFVLPPHAPRGRSALRATPSEAQLDPVSAFCVGTNESHWAACRNTDSLTANKNNTFICTTRRFWKKLVVQQALRRVLFGSRTSFLQETQDPHQETVRRRSARRCRLGRAARPARASWSARSRHPRRPASLAPSGSRSRRRCRPDSSGSLSTRRARAPEFVVLSLSKSALSSGGVSNTRAATASVCRHRTPADRARAQVRILQILR